MQNAIQRKAAKQFIKDWAGKGYEKGQSQPFWLSLLRNVLGVENPAQFISFENQVKLGKTSFIDGYIPSTKVLIEQKGKDIDLLKEYKQADGQMLTPFQQAKRYANELPFSQKPRWIVVCNFAEFHIHDMENPHKAPEIVFLKDLDRDYHRLGFLADAEKNHIKRQQEVSLQAGTIVGRLYDALLKQYLNPSDAETLKSLNKLCVRLVFCMYAEDAGLFGARNKFHDYLQQFDVKHMRKGLVELFDVLNQPIHERDPYLEPDLASFPYVNGGLFDGKIEIPLFSEEIVDLLINEGSEGFNWSVISPTIFGSLFESTLNPETRRKGGMHYTSVENIHKVIDPLFLTDLRAELNAIRANPVERTRTRELIKFQDKLATLKFLDPACGSGNFLTETYICLRRLENEVLNILSHGQMTMGDIANPIKVTIDQFYGVEINDFAASVAQTALWIAESQMRQETAEIVHLTDDYLPLKSFNNIVVGNALTIDWEDVVPKCELSYIMGNPPFIGGMMSSKSQKEDLSEAIGDVKGLGELDYVAGWYYKATNYIRDTKIVSAFVSTNSVCQGQQAVTLWMPLISTGVRIQFAYRTFVWDSEATAKAHVHCVIVGFSFENRKEKALFDGGRVSYVKNINSYLADAPNIFVESRSNPICNIPPIKFGSMPRDGGGFILSDEEKDELLKSEPLSERWIRPYVGAKEFINNKSRWCLWLVGANPSELRKCPTVMQRIESVRDFRANSVAAGTRKFAETPTLFCQIAQPETDYIIVPIASSERRKYVPMGFVDKNVIASNLVFLIPNAKLFHFGILMSNAHMSWMRAVCGRLKSDYRYAKDIVYNNFPWPKTTQEQMQKIEKTAQAILDVRANYPDCSLADLYDSLLMPVELRKAHEANDKAVMEAYGFDKNMSENEIVAELMKMYKALTE